MSKNYGDKEEKDIERIPEAQVSFNIGWSDKFITNIQLTDTPIYGIYCRILFIF